MAESGFEITYEGRERLWIRTPISVYQNVWSSFVFQIFPEFQLPPEHMSQSRHKGRYINRNPEGYDEIADGQTLGYIHAYLPHGERSKGRQGVNGLVHVPEKRIFYLEQIEADLSENPRSRGALLNELKQIHAETVGYLLTQLMDVPGRTEFRDVKTTKELRDKLAENFASIGLLSGCYNNPGEPPIRDYEIGKIPIRKLPLNMKGGNLDFLRTQTCLDFLRDLDNVLREDRELKELGPVNMLQIPLVMREKYSGIVRV